jgi:hypothetical protein
MTREGFYAVYFGTEGKMGIGMVVLDTGRVVGCDPSGTRYDGTYQYNERTGMLDATVVMKLMPGAVLVTGLPSAVLPSEVTVKASLPRDVNAKLPASIDIPGGKIAIVFHKLRDFSD